MVTVANLTVVTTISIRVLGSLSTRVSNNSGSMVTVDVAARLDQRSHVPSWKTSPNPNPAGRTKVALS